MIRILKFLLALLILALYSPASEALTKSQYVVLFGSASKAIAILDFRGGSLPSQVTFTRGGTANVATTSLYTDAPGATVTTYANNVPRFIGGTIPGLLLERSATNFLLASGVPITQTTGILATGNYDLICNGTGTVTSSAGTATASGLGALVCNSSTFQTITVSLTGTLVFTVTGTVNWFDLQNVVFPNAPTSHIVTGASTATRSVDVASISSSGISGWSVIAGATIIRFSQQDGSSAQGRALGTNTGVEFALAGNGSFTDGGSINITTVGASNGFSVNRESASWGPSGASATINGNSQVTSALVPSVTNLSAVTSLYLGSQNGVSQLANMILQKIGFYKSISLSKQLNLTSSSGGF